MSKKPPLGHEFFQRLAERHVEQNLAPQSFEYGWKDVLDRNARPRRFYIQGKTRDNYIRHYLSVYERRYGHDHPLSELIEEHCADDVPFHGPTSHVEWQIEWEKRLTYPQGPDIHKALHEAHAEKDQRQTMFALFDGIPVKLHVGDYGDVTMQDQEGQLWHAGTETELRTLKRHLRRADRASLLRLRRATRAETLSDMQPALKDALLKSVNAPLPPWLEPRF